MVQRVGRVVGGGLFAMGIASLGLACGAGSAAKAVRPDMPAGADALGQGICDPTPYIVDLDPKNGYQEIVIREIPPKQKSR